MKNGKLLSLALGLILTMSLGAGCTTKNEASTVEQMPTVASSSSASAIDVAVKTITDGVVYFDFNKYDVKPEYREVLNQKAQLLRQYPALRIRIEGNCDDRGTQEYNLALGERRARAAYEYLVMLGVNPSQLEMISYGKERPAVRGSGDAVWTRNRRDDFRVIAR